MNYRQPIEPERGNCETRPHASKNWDPGFSIYSWRDDETVMCKKAGSLGILIFHVDNVRVPD